MSTLTSATYTFDPRPELPLLFTVKHLWNDTIPEAHRANGFTIILLHGTGFHKELWEPTIEDLFALLSQGGLESEIREVWTIDSPNHGDSAILNEQAMKFHETICEYYDVCRKTFVKLILCILKLGRMTTGKRYMHCSMGMELV